ncbi:hypothetical protein BOTBODRAFT_59713 [Botryobasidium botryosum FD-172 SS1]|uniref:Seipin n=1 Tax=Botryobasidium botryosum (strain FD-172 SS1) TaxID=930990 RepID=A0A067LWZ0_BOTB1|nr:hypothetical protein BOTBODRAFT_59713 [Botryobasidium botryosum FD-172 SS1]
MNIERTVSDALRTAIRSIESVVLQAVHLIFLPLTYTQPVFRVALFLLLVPPLFLFSFSASLLLWKWVPGGWSEAVLLQYGDIDAAMPYADFLLPSMPLRQPYDISLHLVLPTTESNYALGNFMTTIHLFSSKNETLATSRIPSILPPRTSSSLSLFSKPTFIPLQIPLVRSFSAPTSYPLRARIEIGRKDGWRSLGSGEGRELHVYSAELRGVVKLQGVWALISNHPIIATFLTTALFFMASTTSALMFYFFFPNLSSEVDNEGNELSAVKGKGVKKEEYDEDSARTLLRRRSRTLPQVLPSSPEIKSEEDDNVFI